MTPLRLLRRALFEVKLHVANDARWAGAYRAYVAWDRLKSGLRYGWADGAAHVVTPATELVVDGYQGSANSFAADLLAASTAAPVRVAHHLHAAAPVRRAAEAGVPVVVTIREPRATVRSLVSRWPHVTVRQALRGYLAYYGALAPALGRLVVSPFARTTGDLAGVLDEVNDRHGTAFGLAVDAAAVDRVRAERAGPDPARDARKRAADAALADPALAGLLAAADALHARFAAAARPAHA